MPVFHSLRKLQLFSEDCMEHSYCHENLEIEFLLFAFGDLVTSSSEVYWRFEEGTWPKYMWDSWITCLSFDPAHCVGSIHNPRTVAPHYGELSALLVYLTWLLRVWAALISTHMYDIFSTYKRVPGSVSIHNLHTVAPRYGELLALLVYLTCVL